MYLSTLLVMIPNGGDKMHVVRSSFIYDGDNTGVIRVLCLNYGDNTHAVRALMEELTHPCSITIETFFPCK